MTTEHATVRQASVGQLRVWAKEVLDLVHIENVRLKAADVSSSDQMYAGPFSVKTEISFKGLQLNANEVETGVRYLVTCSTTPPNEDEVPRQAWELDLELRATFSADDQDGPLPGLSKDQLDAFSLVIGMVHVHPYARETVQSLTGRLGYPPFTLDGMTPITTMPDETMVDFED